MKNSIPKEFQIAKGNHNIFKNKIIYKTKKKFKLLKLNGKKMNKSYRPLKIKQLMSI